MNPFLKAVIDEAIDIEVTGQAAVAKSWTGVLNGLLKVGTDAPALLSNMSGAKAELEALLSSPESDADLLAYLAQKLGSQVSPQVVAVIVISAELLLNLGMKSVALMEAIKAAKAVPAAPVQA